MAVPIRLGLLAAGASVCALAMAAPAGAQYRAPYPTPQYQNAGIDARIGQLRVRLDAEYRRGSIARGEFAALRARLDQITRLQRLYYRNGLTAVERADLERRIRDFRVAMRDSTARGGRDGRGGYDRDDHYRDNDRDDDDYRRGNNYGRGDDDDDRRDDDRMDRNRDGWDDRDRDRDGRWQDDVRGEDDDYPNVTLRVGQRATSNLGGVPYQYRDRYRDGGGFYYRSDGRSIYQIDARTNAVVRIYPVGR